jgi:hypothetical protein
MHVVLFARSRDPVFQFVFGLKPIVKSVAASHSAMFAMNPISPALNLVQSGRVTIGMDFGFFSKQDHWIMKIMRAIGS